MTTQENTSPTEENKGQPVVPTTPAHTPEPTSATPNTEATATPAAATTVVEKSDKEVILDDLKKTMHDLGRIPRMLMAPVITYVASKWDTIPQERRQHLQRIAHDLKDSGNDGIHKLKDWFGGKHEDTTTAPADSAADTATTANPGTTTTSVASKESPSAATASKKVTSTQKPQKATTKKPVVSSKAKK